MTGWRGAVALVAGSAGAFVLFAPRAMAQPGPNDPTSQGSSANRTGGEAPSDDEGGRHVVNEDGSAASGFVYEDRKRGFALNVRARMQARATAGGGELAELSERFAAGPAVPRARLVVQGYAERNWLYLLQIGVAPQDLGDDPAAPLLDAHVTWARWRDLRVRAGQMQVPFDRQNLISATSLQTVERSIVSQEFAVGRDVGVLLSSNDLFGLERRVTYAAGAFGGAGRDRVDGWGGSLFLARLELSPLGDFDSVVEADLKRRRRARVAVATVVAYQPNAERARGTRGERLGAPAEVLHVASDVKLKWRGGSFLAQAFVRDARQAGAGEGGDVPGARPRSGLGYFFQGGYMFTDSLELAARWGAARPLGERGAGLRTAREVGAAASYYVHENDIKLQFDYFRVSGGPCDDACHQVRAQLQLSL